MTATMFRTNAMHRGIGEDVINGRQYRTTTDARGRTIIGPARHRKRKGMKKNTTPSPVDLTAVVNNLRAAFPPPPPSQKKPLRKRVADRLRNGWYRITDPDFHKLGQHVALNLLLWVTLAGVASLMVRLSVWAWSW